MRKSRNNSEGHIADLLEMVRTMRQKKLWPAGQPNPQGGSKLREIVARRFDIRAFAWWWKRR